MSEAIPLLEVSKSQQDYREAHGEGSNAMGILRTVSIVGGIVGILALTATGTAAAFSFGASQAGSDLASDSTDAADSESSDNHPTVLRDREKRHQSQSVYASEGPVYTENWVSGDSLSMMKRTHLSLDAIKEGLWLETVVGLGHIDTEYFYNSSGGERLHEGHGTDVYPDQENEAMKSEWDGRKHICSARSLIAWNNQNGTNQYNWHEFQGSQTEAGPKGPDHWWNRIYKANTKMDVSGDMWNVFLHMAQHLYVDDLTMHVVNLEKTGTPYIARTYLSVAEGDEGRTMYVVFIPNPYNGNTVIIHSASVHKKTAKTFRDLEESACLFAVALPFTYDTLQHWYNGVYVTKPNADGLSMPIPVMDSQPTYDMEEVRAYFKDQLQIKNWAKVSLSLYSNQTDSGKVCQVFQMDMVSQMNTDYQARFVYTPNATNFEELGKFHKYMDENVRSTVGFNTGYNRWMDNHWALSLPWNPSNDGNNATNYLDDLRPYLEAAETPYHAHFTELNDGQDSGSIWAWGVSGVAIEWHGQFSYTSFDHLGNFDFCTYDSTCQASDRRCKVDGDDDNAGAS